MIQHKKEALREKRILEMFKLFLTFLEKTQNIPHE